MSKMHFWIISEICDYWLKKKKKKKKKKTRFFYFFFFFFFFFCLKRCVLGCKFGTENRFELRALIGSDFYAHVAFYNTYHWTEHFLNM